MAISKKDQILQLHNKGYGNDEIIKNGFTKKYVNQVLKGFANSDSNAVPTNTNSIDTLKQLISTVEDLQSKYNQLNINISISIKVDGVKNVSVKSDNPLLNPVTTYRDIGKDGLKDKLLLLSIKDLVKIVS